MCVRSTRRIPRPTTCSTRWVTWLVADTRASCALLTRGLGFALPIAVSLALLAFVMPPALQLALAVLAAIAAMVGTLVERWLFFAEARHTVTLYYGSPTV